MGLLQRVLLRPIVGVRSMTTRAVAMAQLVMVVGILPKRKMTEEVTHLGVLSWHVKMSQHEKMSQLQGMFQLLVESQFAATMFRLVRMPNFLVMMSEFFVTTLLVMVAWILVMVAWILPMVAGILPMVAWILPMVAWILLMVAGILLMVRMLTKKVTHLEMTSLLETMCWPGKKSQFVKKSDFAAMTSRLVMVSKFFVMMSEFFVMMSSSL